MTSLVVDASVAVKWVLQEDDSAAAEHVLAADLLLEAPELLRLEVGNALWRQVRAGAVSQEQAERGIVAVGGMIGLWHPLEPLTARALALASMLSHPIYDMAYLALAEQRNARVITADLGFVQRVAASRLAPHIVSLEDWLGRATGSDVR